jgi:hypothetical protein
MPDVHASAPADGWIFQIRARTNNPSCTNIKGADQDRALLDKAKYRVNYIADWPEDRWFY